AARATNTIAGMHTNSVDYARKMIARGMQFVTVMSDTILLRNAAAQTVAGIRETTVKESPQTDAY
ncbi:MAG: hypothetical protein D6737_01115, partial [Chloroflexi bacterium]